MCSTQIVNLCFGRHGGYRLAICKTIVKPVCGSLNPGPIIRYTNIHYLIINVSCVVIYLYFTAADSMRSGLKRIQLPEAWALHCTFSQAN